MKLSNLPKIALGLLALAMISAPYSYAVETPANEKLSKAKEKYDADKDGKLSDEEKAKRQEEINAKAKHTREENLAKYDANKDGKLDEAEKAQKKADEDAAKEAKKAKKAEKDAKQAPMEDKK